ncbi:MAG: 3-phosphoshikimate 1-carboxyvinyltransferase [Methanobacteriota archaeon]
MTLVVRPGRVAGSVRASASKSYTHRAFVLTALAGGGVVTRALLSADTKATLGCLEGLGASYQASEGTVRITGRPVRPAEDVLNVANSGTTLRILSAVAALLPSTTVLTGDASIRSRPMGALVAALSELGARAEAVGREGRPPVIVRGPLRGGEARLPGDVSSQFVSALLVAAPFAASDTRIRLSSPLKSRPYVDVTLEVMRHFGLAAEESDDGFSVPAGQSPRARSYEVPGDFSSAAFPLAAAAVVGGRVTVEGLDAAGAQGDRKILDHLRAFGAKVAVAERTVSVEGTGTLAAIEADVGDTPDLFPVLCAVAAHAKGVSRFHGARHLRFKETDRIRAMVAELSKMGVRIEERDDGAVVHGGAPLSGARVLSYDDHRILMALAVAALGARGETTIDDPGSYPVSYPGFVRDLVSLGAPIEEVDAR